MKIDNNETENAHLYAAFSSIPLDIEGSNLENTGWMPSEEDMEFCGGKESLLFAKKEYEEKNAKVIFKNISLNWDSCDCGDGYGCSHGSYVYDMRIRNGDKVHTVDYTDGDSLEFYNNGKYCKIPTAGTTIYDFIRMCQICEIELELSDYGASLLKNADIEKLNKAPLQNIEHLKEYLEVNAGRVAEPVLKMGYNPKDDPECHKAFLMLAHLQEIQDYIKERLA